MPEIARALGKKHIKQGNIDLMLSSGDQTEPLTASSFKRITNDNKALRDWMPPPPTPIESTDWAT